MLLFHPEPLHDDDMLDEVGARARERWAALGRAPETLAIAREGMEIVVCGRPRAAADAG